MNSGMVLPEINRVMPQLNRIVPHKNMILSNVNNTKIFGTLLLHNKSCCWIKELQVIIISIFNIFSKV